MRKALTEEQRLARNAYLKEWRKLHPEYAKTKNREWYLANREKAIRTAAEWKVTNPERSRELNRASDRRRPHRNDAWVAANPGKMNVYSRASRARHPERHKAAVDAWRKNNPERHEEIEANNRHRRRAAGKVGSVSSTAWSAIKESFDHRCAYCLRQLTRLEQDHVTALSRGGEHTPDNVVPACRSCNARKGNRGILSMLKAA